MLATSQMPQSVADRAYGITGQPWCLDVCALQPKQPRRVGHDQDDTYLYFGIWAREPKEASDTMNLDFQWIAGGGQRRLADQ